MKKKSGGAGVVAVILIAVVIVAAFVLVLRFRPRSAEDTTEVSEMDTLLNIDIAENYPSTPREVMKLYNRYIVCLYGAGDGKMNDAQMQALGGKLRELYDEELLGENPQEINLQSLEEEIGSYREDGKVIIQANVCGSNDVDYVDIDEGSGAFVEVSYFMRGASDPKFTRTYQQFLLRKDAEGDWKILGFKQIDKPASEGD